MSDVSELWRVKYYDKVQELNTAEAKLVVANAALKFYACATAFTPDKYLHIEIIDDAGTIAREALQRTSDEA